MKGRYLLISVSHPPFTHPRLRTLLTTSEKRGQVQDHATTMRKAYVTQVLKVALVLCYVYLPTSLAQTIQGTYRLVDVTDAAGNDVDIPTPKYSFKLTFKEDTEGGALYDFTLVVGNTMFGEMLVDEATGMASLATLASTRMLPQPEEYELERKISAAIRKVSSFKRRGKMIEFSGNKGSFAGRSRGLRG